MCTPGIKGQFKALYIPVNPIKIPKLYLLVYVYNYTMDDNN